MATFPITGIHFTVAPHDITVFHLQGRHLEQTWAMSIRFGPTVESYLLAEVPPTPVLDDILQLIAQDRAHGREQLIDHVLLSSRLAVCLFLEGALPVAAFETAQETADSILLTLELAGTMRRIKIQSEFALDHEMSTRDRTGAIIEDPQ